MNEHILELANEIGAVDRAAGILGLEGIASAEDGRGTAALACLFVLFEHAIRHADGSVEKRSLAKAISNLSKEGVITKDEASVLHTIRRFRNDFIHPNRHEYAFTINGVLYPLSETDGLVDVFELLAPDCLSLALKLMSDS